MYCEVRKLRLENKGLKQENAAMREVIEELHMTMSVALYKMDVEEKEKGKVEVAGGEEKK
ncbi:MAG: hypothetical protein Q9225_004747, partial [Loekoesia sp. 1 TL-2023]